MRTGRFTYLVIMLIISAGCGKIADKLPNNGGIDDNSGDVCQVSKISQVNNGNTASAILTIDYNNLEISGLTIYDSVNQRQIFKTTIVSAAADTIVLDNHWYFVLDAEGRVARYAHKPDASSLPDSVYDYDYNSQGYLETKKFYINNSALPNLRTDYSYTNGKMTGCTVKAESSGDLLVLKSDVVYDTSHQIKSWMYIFPDATESYWYSTSLNFGTRPSFPPTKITTIIYDPATGTTLDTWMTQYTNYQIDKYGYLVSGEANGDVQQGIASFYGKTNFYYNCH